MSINKQNFCYLDNKLIKSPTLITSNYPLIEKIRCINFLMIARYFMLLNKSTLVATLSLFICSSCVTIGTNEAQLMQITNLQTKLLQIEKGNQQTQTQLTNVNEHLKNQQNKLDILTRLVKKETQKRPALPSVKQAPQLDNKTILGQIEWVYVPTVKSNFRARIDTGAETSSINATAIERFERDGKKWVRFTLSNEKEDAPQIIEAKIQRIVRIAQSTTIENETERRFVIKLPVRIGDIAYPTEFTLTDRSHMDFPVLIGRSFLQDVILVDVSKEYIYPKYEITE